MIKKSTFTFSSMVTVVLLLFSLAMVFCSNAKAWVIQQLMVLGFFQPSIDPHQTQTVLVAEDAEFQNAEGKKIHLSDLKGKVVFVNFWGTWCPPCIAEMPSIHSLYI